MAHTIPKVQPLLSKGRSKLIFEFYKGPDLIIRILDFFENLQIKESQKSNLISYNPISRAGNLYAYGGAKSRAFNISFNITSPAIKNVSKNYFVLTRPLSDRHDDFFTTGLATDEAGDSYFETDTKSSIDHYDKNFLKLSAKYQPDSIGLVGTPEEIQKLGILTGGMDTGTAMDDALDAVGGGAGLDSNDQRRDVISVIMYWIELIRSSVVNDAQNPMNGPPIIRLRHGTLYRDVPCVCKGYNITWDEGAGYDLKTLLPRVVKINMQLEEYRLSTEREYKYGVPINRDALAGWEQLMKKPYTMDPGIPNDPVPAADSEGITDMEFHEGSDA